MPTKNSSAAYPYDKRTNTIKLPQEVQVELRGLISVGKKIEAVQRVVHLTGAGLKLSKDYVDNLAK